MKSMHNLQRKDLLKCMFHKNELELFSLTFLITQQMAEFSHISITPIALRATHLPFLLKIILIFDVPG